VVKISWKGLFSLFSNLPTTGYPDEENCCSFIFASNNSEPVFYTCHTAKRSVRQSAVSYAIRFIDLTRSMGKMAP
jgi:hypothetical protein